MGFTKLYSFAPIVRGRPTKFTNLFSTGLYFIETQWEDTRLTHRLPILESLKSVTYRLSKFDIFPAILRFGKMNAFKTRPSLDPHQLATHLSNELATTERLFDKNNAVLSAFKWIWYEGENGQQVFHFQLSATNEVSSQVSFKYKRCVSAKCVCAFLWRFQLSGRSRRSPYVVSHEANLFARILWDFYDTNSNRAETSSQSIKFRGILRDW